MVGSGLARDRQPRRRTARGSTPLTSPAVTTSMRVIRGWAVSLPASAPAPLSAFASGRPDAAAPPCCSRLRPGATVSGASNSVSARPPGSLLRYPLPTCMASRADTPSRGHFLQGPGGHRLHQPEAAGGPCILWTAAARSRLIGRLPGVTILDVLAGYAVAVIWVAVVHTLLAPSHTAHSGGFKLILKCYAGSEEDMALTTRLAHS
jgi:hypothetical protein